MQETQPREFAGKIKTEGGTRRKPSSIRYIPLGSKSGPRNEFVRPSSMAWFHCERRHAKWRYDLPREGRARSSKISRRSFSWTWISPTWDIHQRVFVHDPPLDPWINIYTLLRSFSRWILWSFVVSICRPKVHTRLITFTWYFYAFFYVNPRMMKIDDISRLHIIILSNHIRTFHCKSCYHVRRCLPMFSPSFYIYFSRYKIEYSMLVAMIIQPSPKIRRCTNFEIQHECYRRKKITYATDYHRIFLAYSSWAFVRSCLMTRSLYISENMQEVRDE